MWLVPLRNWIFYWILLKLILRAKCNQWLPHCTMQLYRDSGQNSCKLEPSSFWSWTGPQPSPGSPGRDQRSKRTIHVSAGHCLCQSKRQGAIQQGRFLLHQSLPWFWKKFTRDIRESWDGSSQESSQGGDPLSKRVQCPSSLLQLRGKLYRGAPSFF